MTIHKFIVTTFMNYQKTKNVFINYQMATHKFIVLGNPHILQGIKRPGLNQIHVIL